jgi:hypothetical protein
MNRFLVALVFFMLPGAAVGTTKMGSQVFNKWITLQKVFHDRSIVSAGEQVTDHFATNFIAKYRQKQSLLRSYASFLSSIIGTNVCTMDTNISLSEDAKKNLVQLYAWLDNDMGAFLRYVQTHKFLNTTANEQEQSWDVTETIRRYKKMMKILFIDQDKNIRYEYLFGIANRLFEYCFGPVGCEKFKEMLSDDSLQQMVRLCYSTMWFQLVGEGWKHWHYDCLKNLERESARGKEVVYVAGGNDIYELLMHNVNKIRVIDPMLPSQPLYYAEGWEWLLRDKKNPGIGDILRVDGDKKSLLLKRVAYKESGSFQAPLSTGKTVTLPRSVTTWAVYNATNKKKLGYVIFDRRYCTKSDFALKSDQVLLASFNEMYYIAMPENMRGWGIGIDSLPNAVPLYVKQLRKPVNKTMLKNMCAAEATSFPFIALGSIAT